MNFKDTLKTDLDVFLCQDEFGEIHDLNGRKVTCIVQSPTAREWFQGQKYAGYEGISGREVVIMIKTKAWKTYRGKGRCLL